MYGVAFTVVTPYRLKPGLHTLRQHTGCNRSTSSLRYSARDRGGIRNTINPRTARSDAHYSRDLQVAALSLLDRLGRLRA